MQARTEKNRITVERYFSQQTEQSDADRTRRRQPRKSARMLLNRPALALENVRIASPDPSADAESGASIAAHGLLRIKRPASATRRDWCWKCGDARSSHDSHSVARWFAHSSSVPSSVVAVLRQHDAQSSISTRFLWPVGTPSNRTLTPQDCTCSFSVRWC